MRRFKKFRFILPVLTIFICPLTLTAQQAPSATQQTQTQRIPARPLPDTGNIKQQLIYLIEKSNTYQDYRVIKESWLYKFRTRLNDTVDNLRRQISSNQATISQKTSKIDSLQNILRNTNDELSSTLKEKNSLSFLGISMSKGLYDAIMWVIIITLLAVLTILFILYKRSFVVNSQVKKDLDGTRMEFDDFRKKALKSKEDAVRNIYEELKKYKK